MVEPNRLRDESLPNVSGVGQQPAVPIAAEGVEALASVDSGVATEAPTPLWRRIPTRLVVLAVIVVVASIAGWYFNASRSSSGQISRAGDLAAADLRVGDCFDFKDPSADAVGDVTARPCTDEHEYEMFFVGSLPGGEYPAKDAFETFAHDNCIPAFTTYVGKVYEESKLDFYWLFPEGEAWGKGDRSVQCAVYDQRIHRLTDSVKGSKQ
jgi:hypothetical protein